MTPALRSMYSAPRWRPLWHLAVVVGVRLAGGRRDDVVVEAEHVARVILGFDGCQARVVRPVRGSDPIGAFLAKVVGVHRSFKEWLHRFEETLRPGDVVRRIGGIIPLGENEEVVEVTTVWERGRCRRVAES